VERIRKIEKKEGDKLFRRKMKGEEEEGNRVMLWYASLPFSRLVVSSTVKHEVKSSQVKSELYHARWK